MTGRGSASGTEWVALRSGACLTTFDSEGCEVRGCQKVVRTREAHDLFTNCGGTNHLPITFLSLNRRLRKRISENTKQGAPRAPYFNVEGT